MKVLALDADDGSNGEVEYTLMGGAEGYFDIDPVSGDITVQNVMGLDVENRNFTLLVQASDKGESLGLYPKTQKLFCRGREVLILSKGNSVGLQLLPYGKQAVFAKSYTITYLCVYICIYICICTHICMCGYDEYK